MRRRGEGWVVAVGNQKGGVGKTTNAVHLAAALGEAGIGVLLVDLDVSANASAFFGVSAPQGTFEVLTGKAEPRELIFSETEEDAPWPEGVDLLPSTRALENLESALIEDPRYRFASTLDCLRPLLAYARRSYDVTILDMAPTLKCTTTRASYLHSDAMLLSTVPDYTGWKGVQDAMHDLQTVQGMSNVFLLGILLCKVDPRVALAKEYWDALPEELRAQHFVTRIRSCEQLRRAHLRGRTLFAYRPTEPVLEDFRELAAEALARLDARVRPEARLGRGE